MVRHVQRPEQVVEELAALARRHPDSLLHTARLATVLDRFGLADRAIRQYLQLLDRRLVPLM